MLRLVVASGNPVKRRAAETGFRAVFPEAVIEVECADVDSGVADQPMGDAETRRGALARAQGAREAAPGADYWFGIEGGVADGETGLAAFAWIVVMDASRTGFGRTAEFLLPPPIAERVRGGMELGTADDEVFGRTDSKRRDGAIGLLSGGALDRAGLYRQGVIAALLPFRNPELYRARDIGDGDA